MLCWISIQKSFLLHVVTELLFLLLLIFTPHLSTIFDTINRHMLFAALADPKIAESVLPMVLPPPTCPTTFMSHR